MTRPTDLPSAAALRRLEPCQVRYCYDEDPHGPLVLWRPDLVVPSGWIVGPGRIVPCGRLGFRRRSGEVFCRQHSQEFCVCSCGRETEL